MDAVCGARVAITRSDADWGAAFAKWNDEHCTKAGKPAASVLGTAGTADSRLQLNQGRVDAAVQGAVTVAYRNTVEENRYLPGGKAFYLHPVGIGFLADNPQLGQALRMRLQRSSPMARIRRCSRSGI